MLVTTYRRAGRSLARTGRWGLALLLLCVALANAASALAAQPWRPASLIEQIIDLDGIGWGRVGVLTTAALLLLIARALARGKRHAWLLATGLLTLSLVGALLDRAGPLSILVIVVLLAILLALAPLFSTRSDTWASVRGYAALALGGWLTWGHTLLLHLWHAELPRLPYVPLGAVTPVLVVLRGLTYLILGYGVVQLLRPALVARGNQREERERAAAVIWRWGRLSTVYFALGADKSYFWSPSGRSLLAYRVTLGVALVLSDPIGPEDEREPLLRSFVAYCRKQDWQVALYQTTPKVTRLCRAFGMHAYKIGEDATVDVTHFTLQGRIGAPVRHSVARARRGGLTVRIFQGETLPEAIFAGMKRISAAWLQSQHATVQFGYSMGRFPVDWSPDLLTAVALGPDGEVQAYITWTPLYASNGWSLDNMRRDEGTEPGAIELLVAESIAWARERGATQVTLGLVPLAGLGVGDATPPEAASSDTALPRLKSSSSSGVRVPPVPQAAAAAPRAPLLERSAAYLHRRGLLLGNYRSLHAFKAKFQAEWEARYLVVDEIGALPRVLSALGVAMGIGWRGMLRDAWDALVSADPMRGGLPQSERRPPPSEAPSCAPDTADAANAPVAPAGRARERGFDSN
jgi:phosphatidylglycerol lysyltransferase